MDSPAQSDASLGTAAGGFHAISRIRLANRAAELGRMEAWFEGFASALAIDAGTRYRLDLILNEAANNIIDYAWDDGAEHFFHIAAAHRDGEVAITFEDDGGPFNPLEHPPPPRPERLEDAPVGGLGIHLIRSQCDGWEYRRSEGLNRLTVVVRQRDAAASPPQGAVPRGPDRRRSPPPGFPLTLADGAVIPRDRRREPDRRANAFISGQQLCSDIPYDLVESVLAACEQRRLAAGDILLEPGQLNEHLFLVLEGRFQVHLDAANSRLGFPIDAGECIGEMSIIDGKPVSAYVVAEQPSVVLPVHKDLFWEHLAQTPLVTRNLMQLLAERMRRRNDVMLTAMEHQLRLEHLARELATARQIQASMLPKQFPLFPQHPQLDVHAIMEPAREVGGDFFDAFAVGEGQVCIAVGDVSDKGIPAALFMVRTMTLLRMEMLATASVDALLPTVNRQLATGNQSFMFVTVFVGLLDVSSGRLRYVSGGHPPPLLQRAGAGARPVAPPKGILVGVAEDARYEVAELTLEPGDRLTLYTDGITEAENPAREQFTDARLAATLDALPAASAEGQVKGLRDAVRDFAAGAAPSDDLTLLVLRYLGA